MRDILPGSCTVADIKVFRIGMIESAIYRWMLKRFWPCARLSRHIQAQSIIEIGTSDGVAQTTLPCCQRCHRRPHHDTRFAGELGRWL